MKVRSIMSAADLFIWGSVGGLMGFEVHLILKSRVAKGKMVILLNASMKASKIESRKSGITVYLALCLGPITLSSLTKFESTVRLGR
jgi:hypothetical protein